MRIMSNRLLSSMAVTLFLCCAAASGQYQSASAGAPPAEAGPAMRESLQKDGIKITSGGTPYAELWFRTAKPAGGSGSEDNATLSGIAIGAFVGLIRFDGPGADRRGQQIKPGVYALRYALMPVNGDHQGAAPQRDFLVLTQAAEDQDPKATPKFDDLISMSRRASGTPHPAVLSFWKADMDAPGLAQQGEDWVLETKLGDTPIAVIVIGAAAI